MHYLPKTSFRTKPKSPHSFCRLLCLAIGLLGTQASAQLAHSAWPKALGNAQNTSLSTGFGTVAVVKWINPTALGCPIIGPDGTVYTGGYTSFSAVNGQTGATKYTINTQFGDQGNGLALGQDGLLYGPYGENLYFSAVKSLDGSFVWSRSDFASPANGYSNAAIGLDGTVLVTSPGSSKGPFFALDPATGNTKWTFTSGIGDLFCATVSPDGTIYDTDGGVNLYALNYTTGQIKWQAAPTGTVGGFWSPMALGSNGSLYFLSQDYKTENFVVCAFDSENGQELWSTELDNQVDGDINGLCLGPNNSVVVATQIGGQESLLSLDGTTGDLLWSVQTDVQANPVVGADGTIFVAATHAINAFNGLTGALVWSYNLGPSVGPVGASDAIGSHGGGQLCMALSADGLLYISTSAGLYCLDSEHVTSMSINPTSVFGGMSATGTVTVSYPAPAGGAAVLLSSPNASVSVPASVTVPAGQTSVTFTIKTVPVDFQSVATITAAPGGNQTATLTVNPAILSALSLSPTTVLGGNSSTGTVTLGSPAGPSGIAVNLTSSNTAATVPTSVTVVPGQTTATFTVMTTGVNAVTTSVITVSAGSLKFPQTMTIDPPTLLSVSLNPPSVQGGTSSTGTVTLSGAASPSGTTVSLSSSSSNASVPASVTVASGITTATFTVGTIPVSSQSQAVITGTLNKSPQTASLTITPATLVSLALSPASVQGGTSSTGTITLSGAAPTGGTAVALTSGTAAATVPSSVVVPVGQSTTTFTVSTTPVAAQTTAVITATLNKLPQTATLTITPEVLLSVTLSPTSVQGGASSTGTVTLSAPSPTGGTSVGLTSGNAAATVPSSVTVAAGQTTATFTVSTTGVNTQTSALITGTLNNKPQTATLTITPAALFSISLSPASVQGGTPSTGTLTLSGPAGSGGTTIALSSNTPAATVPTSVTVPSGQTSATFKVTTLGVNAKTTAIMSGSLNGTSQTANLTITPVGIQSFSLSPTTVFGGNASTGTVTLNGPAGIGGSTVTLGSSSSLVTPPGSVTIAQGQTSATFQVQTSAVNSTVAATLTANLNGMTSSALLTVTAPVLQSLTISPSSLAGAGTSTGTVTFSGVAPASGITVSLLSSSSSATVPSSVKVLAGQSSVSFSISAISVTASTTITISATANFVSKSATLTLNPIQLVSLTLNPSAVNGGASSTGTVALNGPAGKGGLVVHLKSSLIGVTVPATLPIAAGQSSSTFKVTTVGVSTQKVATITATLGAVTETATLTVNAPVLSGISLNPSSVTGSLSSTGAVTLSGAAPSTGLVVKLSSSSTNATLPVSVTIPSGKSTAIFTVKTLAVPTQTSASISGSLNGVTESATLTINPPTILTFLVMPASVKGGSTSTGRITLNAFAPKGGLVISLSAGQSDATVPTTLAIAAGATSGTFTIKTGKVKTKTSATISASATGTTKTAGLTITP